MEACGFRDRLLLALAMSASGQPRRSSDLGSRLAASQPYA
jgi:hypothetical protein